MISSDIDVHSGKKIIQQNMFHHVRRKRKHNVFTPHCTEILVVRNKKRHSQQANPGQVLQRYTYYKHTGPGMMYDLLLSSSSAWVPVGVCNASAWSILCSYEGTMHSMWKYIAVNSKHRQYSSVNELAARRRITHLFREYLLMLQYSYWCMKGYLKVWYRYVGGSRASWGKWKI